MAARDDGTPDAIPFAAVRGHAGLLLAAAVAAALMPGAVRAAARPIGLRQIRHIHIPAEPNAAETQAAALLASRLGDFYKLELATVRGAPPKGRPAIVVGRAAVAAGLVAPGGLEGVRPDGYVLAAAGNRLGLAGYARQGTVYAAWALLRRLGLQSCPWHHGSDGGAAERFQPLPHAAVEPFRQSSAPFFTHRSLLEHLDRGRWGGTLRQYTLGDPSQAADQHLFGRKRKKGYTPYKLPRDEWTDWFHTAAYLVPRDRYYETHPDYFAIHRGKRIPPSRYARCAICDTHPDVRRISAQRALEWMDIQSDRRLFCVAPADTALCQCPRCLAADPLPGRGTDRSLAWVNHVAAAAQARHPDKVIHPGAYMETVKPPVRVRPEANVVVMYCPWFWTSRATSEVSFASPLNVVAMKELMAWVMRFPGQVGLYDYPTDCARGTAERVKLYARLGVRLAYFNGARGSRLHWLVSQLLWDPFQDVEALEAQFAQVSYGPAAEPMAELYRLRRAAVERHAAHARAIFRHGRSTPGAAGKEYFARAGALLRQAADRARQADAKTRMRVLGEVADHMHGVLLATHPTTGNPDARSDPQAYKPALADYVRLVRRYLADGTALRLRYLVRIRTQSIGKAMAALGLPPACLAADIPGQPAVPIGELIEKALAAPPPVPPVEPRTVAVRFDSADEAGKWLSDGTQPALISPPALATLATPGGGQLRGVRIAAPLSRLPTIPKGNIRIHAGRFYAERVFARPIDVAGCHALHLHVHASRDVPITLYVDNVHSDVDLHAGEQIVRVDLRNYGAGGRFDWRKWTKLARLAIDIWPQDNTDPFPKVQDAEVVLLGVTASNQRPAPARLPHRGRAVWLSQFRPNVPRGVAVPRPLFDKLMQRQKYKHPGLDYYSKYLHEQFRTFTEHRAVSPIYAILTSDDPAPAELEAARALQEHLAVTGVTLPINPPGLTPGPHLGNAILLGGAAVAAGRVRDIELGYVGPQGFVIHAHHGRIAIAGRDANATACGVARYLEDHGARFYPPDAPRKPTLARGFLHELYLPDRPFFADRPIPGGWRLGTTRPAQGGRLPRDVDVAALARLAEGIKDAARRGERAVPPRRLGAAERSPPARYLAAKLLWDPFADATRIIRELPRPTRPASR